jgi:hypothetical protein
MKTFPRAGFLLLALMLSANLGAQENIQANNNLLSYFDTELFRWDYNMFGGLTLNFHNESSVTDFGIKYSMKNALAGYEDTNQQYRLYRGKTIAGNILLWGGLATTLAGAFTPVFKYRQNNTIGYNNLEKDLKFTIGLVAGGAIAEMIGAFILQSGRENIFQAANSYNRHRIGEY